MESMKTLSRLRASIMIAWVYLHTYLHNYVNYVLDTNPAIAAFVYNKRGMKFDIKEFIFFAVILFFGGLIGQYGANYLGVSGTDVVSRAIAFLVPTVVIYVIWVNWGKKTSETV